MVFLKGLYEYSRIEQKSKYTMDNESQASQDPKKELNEGKRGNKNNNYDFGLKLEVSL